MTPARQPGQFGAMDTGDYMALALAQAKAAGARGEVPVGAVLVDSLGGAVLAEDGNRVEGSGVRYTRAMHYAGPR